METTLDRQLSKLFRQWSFSAREIVVVGANDGQYGDPLFRIRKSLNGSDRILFVEPNTEVASKIHHAWSSHKNWSVDNTLVGNGQQSALYSVNPEIFEVLEVDYGKNWPTYRAPSGISSENLEHVEVWLDAHLNRPRRASDIIKKTLTSSPIKAVLQRHRISFSPFYIQIDVEGSDCQILLTALRNGVRPRNILYEHSHSPVNLQNELTSVLKSHGYSIQKFANDTLASIKRFPRRRHRAVQY